VNKFLSGIFGILLTAMSVGCSDVGYSGIPSSENFDQNYSYNNKVDILWVVDNSSSMQQHQSQLSDQIPEMVAKLNSLKMDYHMGVVTSSMGGTVADGGKLVGSPKYFTNKSNNVTGLLRSRLIVGQLGSNNEKGLESAEAVLSSGYATTEGKGFMRDDALLVVIVLSDEDDKSRTAASAVSYYTGFFDSIKKPWSDGSRSWVMNFIGVLGQSSACRTFNDYSEPGAIFMGLADVSGGVKESICTSNLSTAVGNIRKRIAQIMTDFKLKDWPKVDTITVLVNGVSVPRSQENGWDYFEAGNFIRFYGTAVPPADASIKVGFDPR
jgi:hypothetical protein